MSLAGSAKVRAREAFIRLLYGPRGLARATVRKRLATREIERIVVVRPDHLGDLLFATPALARLRKAFPGAHITGAVGPWGQAMWEGNPSLNSLEIIQFPGITTRHVGGPLGSYLLLGSVGRRLAHRGYDLGVVLRFDHWWGAALVWWALVLHRWGYDTPGMNTWLTETVPYTPGRHEVEQNLYLTEAVIQAMAGNARAERIGPLEVRRQAGIPALRPPQPEPPAEGIPGDWLDSPRRVVIHPGTVAANKLWTIAGWAEIADWLASEGWVVALTGSSGERPLTNAIESAATTRPLNLAGGTSSINQLAWVLDRAQMVLGVDSGPLHLADALGKPTLHLYGPSDETRWGPWGDPHVHRAFRAPGTRPIDFLDILSKEIEGGPEMRAITPGMVKAEIQDILGSTRDEN